MNSLWHTSLPHLNFRIQVRFSWLIGSQCYVDQDPFWSSGGQSKSFLSL